MAEFALKEKGGGVLGRGEDVLFEAWEIFE